MQPENPQPLSLDEALQTLLVCPFDRKQLRRVELDGQSQSAEQAVRCDGCGLRFPIVDGIVDFLDPREP